MSVLDLQTVQCHLADGVGRITLNRPDSLNAWNRQLGDDLLEALATVADDRSVRVVVITGAGRAFSSGADLKGGIELTPEGAPDVLTPLREAYNPFMARLRALPKPVIAAVNGPAVGIGCSLALACDLIVAARSAYFLLAFVNIGLGLDGGASQSLSARVGAARALEMALLGDRITAERALEWGMVNEVVDDDVLPTTVDALAGRLAVGSPGAFAAIKHTINERLFSGFAEQLDLEAVLQQQRAASADFAAAVVAFAEKRKPTFTGE